MDRIAVITAAVLAGAAAGALGQSARLRHINPPSLAKPTGYTHVVAPLHGRLVFVAGQVAVDSAGAVVGKGDFAAQATQVFENLEAAVKAAGGTMADVAKITVYATDLSQIAAFRDVRNRYFTGNPPASTLVQVVGLARPEYLLEVEAIVVVE